MKQIGFIIIVSISGLYAAHHLRMINHPAHSLHHGKREMKPESKSAVSYHQAIQLKKKSQMAESLKTVILLDQKQIRESDNFITNQMSDEINIANLRYINEESMIDSDLYIHEQFNDLSIINSDHVRTESGDTEISKNFYLENL